MSLLYYFSKVSWGKIRYSRFHHRAGPVGHVQARFSAVKVLKFTFHTCAGRVRLVDACLSAGKIR